ncbi:MAG: hypothetical protein QXO84_02490 [Candidatus Aenigmatarchaeota archaeon]
MDIKNVFKDKTMVKIFKLLFQERQAGKPGLSLTELSKKTGIERHKLAGMLEVLAILGLIMFFEMGMSKIVAPTENLLKMKQLFQRL